MRHIPEDFRGHADEGEDDEDDLDVPTDLARRRGLGSGQFQSGTLAAEDRIGLEHDS